MENNLVNLLQKVPEDKIKRCPSCQSVFVTEAECESCGLQLQIDIIGHPLSERGFYSLKEDYYESLGPLVRRFPIFHSKESASSRKYQRQLFRRFDLLMKYFSQTNIEIEEAKNKKLFQVELKDLLTELLENKHNADLLIEKLENCFAPTSILYQTCMSRILESSEATPVTKGEWKLFGLFGKNGIALLLLYIQIIICSILLFSRVDYLSR